jgi:tetratricopeptide (TPR) repeat protein
MLLNIGLIYYNQGNHSKALECYIKALEIQEKNIGKGSIETASTLLNIGLIYFDQKEYQKALNYYN